MVRHRHRRDWRGGSEYDPEHSSACQGPGPDRQAARKPQPLRLNRREAETTRVDGVAAMVREQIVGRGRVCGPFSRSCRAGRRENGRRSRSDGIRPRRPATCFDERREIVLRVPDHQPSVDLVRQRDQPVGFGKLGRSGISHSTCCRLQRRFSMPRMKIGRRADDDGVDRRIVERDGEVGPTARNAERAANSAASSACLPLTVASRRPSPAGVFASEARGGMIFRDRTGPNQSNIDGDAPFQENP